MTWATNLASRARQFSILVRIEGVGSYDGQYTFCTSVPAYGDATYLPYLAGPPATLSERVDLEGGAPESSACTIEIVDIANLLTQTFRTDRDPITALAAAYTTADTLFTVQAITTLAAGQVIWIGSEALRITGVSSLNLTVTRGWLDTAIVEHAQNAPVFNSLPYINGRRFEVFVVPTDSIGSGDERLVGTYVIDGLEWTSDTNNWVISGVSQLRFLDRIVNREVRTAEIFALLMPGLLAGEFSDTNSTDSPTHIVIQDGAQASPEPLFPALSGGNIVNLLAESGEIVRVTTSGGWNNLQYLLPQQRGIARTRPGNFEVGGRVTQVFVAGSDMRYSPGPSPSTSRSTGTWTQATHWVDLTLILMLSAADDDDGLELVNRLTTGTSDWARSNFSSLPPGYGIGLPQTLVDWDAFEAVRARTLAFQFPNFVLGREPKPFLEVITENFLRPMGATISIESGTVSLILPRIGITGEAATVTLGPENLLTRDVGRNNTVPRISLRRDRAAAVGEINLKIGPNPTSIILRNSDFGRTYGQRGYYGSGLQSLEIAVPGGDPSTPELYSQRAAARLFRKQRPPAELIADVDFSLWENATPGVLAGVTIPELPDQANSVRGWTDALCEIAEREAHFDPGGDGAYAKLKFRKYGGNVRVGRICPSAEVVSYAPNGSDVDVTVTANIFTHTDGAVLGLPVNDARAFTVGDLVKRVATDGSDLGGGLETVVAISTSTLTLSGDFGAALTAGEIITYVDSDDATETQLARFVYLSDRANMTVGDTAQAPWIWGEP